MENESITGFVTETETKLRNRKENKMSNYTVNILKTMISAGVSEKPADCPQNLWDQAQIKDVTFEEVETKESNVPATVQHADLQPIGNNYPSSYGLDSFGATAAPISVDGMLKIKSGTLMLNGKEVIKAPFRAKLLIGESKFKRSIKCNVNGQIQYFSTYGGGRCTNGQNWTDVVANCQAVDSTAYEYESADLCFELLEAIKDTNGGVAANVGQRIGYTTAATNRAEIAKFKDTCLERGLNLANAEVEVKVGFKLNSNKANQNWTTITLEVL